MDPSQSTAPTPNALQRISPTFWVGCGIALIMGAGVMYWLEPGRTSRDALVSEQSEVDSSRIQARLAKARAEREARAREEQERQAAEDAAAEKARRALLMADGSTETQARIQQEEMARKRAAVDEARRASEESEDAWKRFYKPSAACKDPAAGATVECVNEFVKAKREFEARKASASSR
jgi:hypothetical protein